MTTKIEWCAETWNPVTGCTRVSLGCERCYAERMARRLDGRGIGYNGTTKATKNGPRWSGKVNLLPERLEQPLRWRKPRRVFVCSMGDLFHEDVPAEFIDRVFATMANAHQHTFQVLTKRPERMVAYLVGDGITRRRQIAAVADYGILWPLPNVWLMTSVENQATADERIPHLLRCPAAVRGVSMEPLLGEVDLREFAPFSFRPMEPETRQHLREIYPGGLPANSLNAQDSEPLHWVIVGAESGPGSRPMDIAWARSVVEQCRPAGVACFVKQVHVYRCPVCHCCSEQMPDWPSEMCDVCQERARRIVSHSPSEWPEDLRVREYPGADR